MTGETLSVRQVCDLLGKTRRQVVYMIRTGRLYATKRRNGRWAVIANGLPASARRQPADEASEEPQPEPASEGQELRTVRDLPSWKAGEPLYRELVAELGPQAAPTKQLRASLDALCRGFHAFERHEKASQYRAARAELADGVTMLLLDSDPEDERPSAWVDRIEGELLPLVTDLIRSAWRREPE